MHHTQKKNKRLTLKAMALIIGSSLWLALSYDAPILLHVEVPLSFYNHSNALPTRMPETLTVALRAPRKELYRLPYNALAIHIDAQAITEDTHAIRLTKDMLLLPAQVQLVHPTTIACR